MEKPKVIPIQDIVNKMQANREADHRNRSPNGYKFAYHWLHIPTGKTGQNVRVFWNREEFYTALNAWNAQQPGVWQYYE